MALQVTKQVQKNTFISNALPVQVWWCNIKLFLSYSKNYIFKFIPLSLVLLNLEIVERKGKKLQKLEYPENEKSFLDEIKNIFHSFWRAIIWWKKLKIANTSFNRVTNVKVLKSKFKIEKSNKNNTKAMQL